VRQASVLSFVGTTATADLDCSTARMALRNGTLAAEMLEQV
jgi:hypothetical protein